MVRKEKGGQTEVVWICHEERPGVSTKKNDGNVVAGKKKKLEAKEKISDVVKEDTGKRVVREKDIKNRMCGGISHAVATPD